MFENSLETKVVINIAQGSNTFYALTVKNKIGSNDGVLNALERLVNKKYIKKGPVGARNSQPYLLMEDGFDVVIRYTDKIKDFDTFVKQSRPHFPLVFKYWDSLGNHNLQKWVKNTIIEKTRIIDAAIRSQLISGYRERYSHEEFINDLYDQIYGPWFTVRPWSEFVRDKPKTQIKAFLKENSEVLESRIEACEKNRKLIENMLKFSDKYQSKVLE